MLIFLQGVYLFLVTCEFLVRGGSSQDLTGNCSFDDNKFCNWFNERYTDHFDWLLLQGRTPSSGTGPISDHSGNGSYIYIETSHPRKYNEKARLNSPWMRGAQRMAFFYSMYGSTVESLSVYARTLNGSESRVWSRYRSHVSEDWIKACVTINYTGIYQVIIEGVAGMVYTSDIAIDDISFSKNLTCVSSGRNTRPEIFEANCTFDTSYCGWRNVFWKDDIDWHARKSGTPSIGTGPSQDHTGGGFYIYIEASSPATVNQTAQLLSPLIRGPKCFRFYYHMYGHHIGRLDVSLQIRGHYGDSLLWRRSGEQGDQWRKATVEIGYTGECQIVLKAAVGRSYAGDIAVDDVTLTDGPCENGGNCNFDEDMCFWRNVNNNYHWSLRKYTTPSLNTGPRADHTSGDDVRIPRNGMYIYIETSSPRNPGDTAQLESPRMRGPQCMTFYYHMYGSTMSCVIIYIKIQATNRLKPVWLKSQDRGDRWIPGKISINETGNYQIIIHGIRGSSYLGDAALDDFSFQKGTCQQKEVTTYHVSSYKGRYFRLSSQPFDHSLYSEEFRFTLEHPQGNPKEIPYFIYSGLYRRPSLVASVLDVSNSRNFPLDVVVQSSAGNNSRRISLVDMNAYGHMISLEDYENNNCCTGKIVFSFYALNITEPGKNTASGCEPGWFRASKSCHLFHLSSRRWGDARSLCHSLGAELAVVNDVNTLQDLANQRREIKLDDRDFYLGLSGQLLWIWSDGEVVSNTHNLWGPNQPSGDGKCGTFLNAIRWDSNWLGYGWRWNDESCTNLKGYICQQPLAVPLPVALFSLSGTNGTVDISPNGATKAVSSNITFAPGPFGNPNGSFFFSGDESSYVELTNTGEPYTRFSISVFAWVHLHNSSGPIYRHEPEYYGFSLQVIHSTLGVSVRYLDRITFRRYLLHKTNVLEADAWNFIGTTYDFHTGVATIFVNNNTVMLKVIKAKMELSTDSNVRIGAMRKINLYFRGRISCLQVYDQPLSVDQIIKVKTRCNQAAPLTCSPSFFAFHGGCFSVNTKNLVTWKDALAQCNSDGGTLAMISREGLRYAFSNMLEAMRPKPDNLHLGMLTRDEWVWIDGSPLNSSLWMPGYPSGYHGVQSCAVLSARSSGIKNADCQKNMYPLCQKKLVNSLTHRSSTQSSSALLPHYSSLAIDRTYTTCFRSQKELNPWWQITLEKALYVISVEITDKIGCCPRDNGMINVTVSTSQTGLNPTCTGSLQYGKSLVYKIQCSPPAHGNYVTVTLFGKNVTLVLCQVVVRTIEFSEEVHGVLREAWYNVNYDSKKAPTMRENPAFKIAVQSQIVLRDFDAPINVGEKYVQRLTSYLQVPESGNYTFYVSCDDLCELWKHDVTEDGIEKEDKKAEESVTKQPIISMKRRTSHHEWDRYADQKSQSVFLDKCRLYRMEAFMREETGNDHMSVGMRTPSGQYERPIPGTRLFWTKPGTRRLEVKLQHHKTSLSATVGSNLHISGFYRFCCQGVYCPDCPLELNISTLGQNVSVNSALNLSCVNTSFTATFNTDRQPGNFTIKVSYSFVNNSEPTVDERVLGQLHLRAVVVKECHFESGYCSWTSLGDKEKKWKLSNAKTFKKYPTHFAYIDGSIKAKLESPQLPWKPFHPSVGLCLRFNYLMPAQSKSSLKVFLRNHKREEPVLVWQLIGNHGVKWSAAQVAWSGAKGIQIIFEGEGFVTNEINVAIDDVIITTENCSLRPYFSEPGFKCSDNKFTCNNGECVKKNLLCDGDSACKDGSDEENCECRSSMFSCKVGKCLLATAVCDGKNDCSNEDESNCRNPCPSSHQCLDGSCISWSKTCSQTPFCRDGTNTPSVCGSGKCHLDDLACTSKNTSVQKRCRSFRGHCNFQTGRCGMKPDKNATFHWSLGSGQTPTENTGPSYDHTSFNKDGSYIFIEASPRSPGDKARLLSGWMEPNETVCVQFWYHMHGSDIGNLSIYLKTNQSETLVWRLSGDQGNRWKFGQTALNSPSLYKFVLEGVVGAGSKSDVAVDDLTVLDGICEKILKQSSPDCYFEESMCDWKADKGWVHKTYLSGLEKRGGYVSLPGGEPDVPSFLSSPVFNTHAYEWKCLRFWYMIGHINDHIHDWFGASLVVLLDEVSTNQTKLLLFTDKVTNAVRFMQIPLPNNSINAQIHFVGWSKFSLGPFIAIDDVSFSKEPCEQIPLNPGKECQGALGMENGAISDSQITASSQWDGNHAPSQGRLHFKKSGNKQGSWSAARSDSYQWLQIDLGSQYARVTRVATQGRNAHSQWITKYKLQYSNDGVNFQYYREQGQTADKEFDGNRNSDSVVYHELHPPTRARYVRFRPIAWFGAISMRVELYGCKDDRPCDISVEWCGWKSVRGWKRIKYKELDQDDQDYGGDDDGDENGDHGDAVGLGLFDPGNYEIHLPDIDLGYVSFSDISPLHLGFTLCFWLKTEYSGFFIEYKVATEQNESLVLGVYCGNNTFEVQLEKKGSKIPLGVSDNTWHHVCVLWEVSNELLEVLKDGERKYLSTGFQSSTQHVGIEGGGTMTIGFRDTNKTASVVLGALSGFNLWSYPMNVLEILRMSHGCGTEAGDVKAWKTVRKGLQQEVAVEWFRTCNDRKGDRLVVDSNATHLKQSAVLVSPTYNRSRDWHSECLRFRYMLMGPGKKNMTIYQKTNSFREVPIWISKHNTGPNWFYGQVPLSSVSKFQVFIKGEAEKNNDLIALTGLYIDKGKHCKFQPLLAKQACSENLFNMSAYFFSPSFPGYYLDDIFCTWHITVPSRYIIHLEFQEFRLKDDPMCEKCFLQIFDGQDKTAPALSRFCGYVYPPTFVSSSNHFTIVLRCHENLHGTRFKAFYYSVAANDDQDSSCSRQQGCPSSCKCEEIGEDPNKKILVTGEDLLTVPTNLPSNTGAVIFQKNRISQLREKDFINLTKLEYIDMSFNILLRLDEDSFQNVPSVKTLRLNSNFFRTIPVGAFTGLPNLRVLDLGRNLLNQASSRMFEGLSSLEVLSLRSNQIEGMEYGVFDNNSNMTHLYLQENKLTTLPDGLFGALSKLKVLDLSSNELTTVTKGTFQGLKSLEYLYLNSNKLSDVPSDAFSELKNMKYLKLDRFILCCYAKKSIVGVDCESPVDEFSSCDDLMKNNTLQICIWILGILAFAGNLLVIIWRAVDKEENRVQSFLLTNLAVADLLMGVYLLTIAIMDLRWQGQYFKHDIEWRSGMGCRIAGVLSMLSSEVSVLILTVITIDRLICIVFPFKFRRLTFKTSVFACMGVWIFGVVISVIPITGISYFYGDESAGNFGFYSRSAVCLPLQLSEGTPAGWEYSVAFFVCLNFVSFTFILVAYISMFWTVKRASRAARSTNLNKESALAKRLVFIVMTDFCCWMPIIIINILSLTGNFEDPNKIAYVWIAVFVLPLNSSLNPILYTFSTERTKRSLTRKRKNVTGVVMKRLHRRMPGRRQTVDWLKTSDDITLVTNVIAGPSPLPSPRPAETQERESKQVHTKLKLIEQVNILQDDTAGKRLTGYAVAWCEEGTFLSMVLLKYFAKEFKEDWLREVDVVQGLSCGREPLPELLHYRWHSKARDQNIEHGKAKIRELNTNSLLICYDFVSSSTLEDFICEKGTVLNFDAVCAIACDVISAIERLQDLGILHNNVTTKNILIGQCPRLPPIAAVLGGFSRASKLIEAGAFPNLAVDEQSNCGNDIEQFGQLLATLLGHCHGSSEYIQLHEIMKLCFEETVENRPKASYIRELLEEAWYCVGIWDTCL